MGEKWREMGEEEKAPWQVRFRRRCHRRACFHMLCGPVRGDRLPHCPMQAKAAEDKARYEAELAAYNAEHGDTLAQKRAKERAAARGSSCLLYTSPSPRD